MCYIGVGAMGLRWVCLASFSCTIYVGLGRGKHTFHSSPVHSSPTTTNRLACETTIAPPLLKRYGHAVEGGRGGGGGGVGRVSYPGPQGVKGPPGPENTYRHPIVRLCGIPQYAAY